jgi:hypothetical protein
MSAPTPNPGLTLDCAAVDELDAAYALDALDRVEREAVEAHLATCPRPHAALRSMLGSADLLAASVEPVAPSRGLRDRVLATVEALPQEGAVVGLQQPRRARPTQTRTWSERWLGWLSPGVARGLAAAAVVVAIALGAWNVSLQGSLASRDQELRAVATAISGSRAAFRASGSVGAGYVVEDGSGRASLIVADLPALEANRIYELWLIGADKTPVAVGTFSGSSGPVAVVALERGLGDFTTFAVTVESRRVDAPTSQPVMVANLSG